MAETTFALAFLATSDRPRAILSRFRFLLFQELLQNACSRRKHLLRAFYLLPGSLSYTMLVVHTALCKLRQLTVSLEPPLPGPLVQGSMPNESEGAWKATWLSQDHNC